MPSLQTKTSADYQSIQIAAINQKEKINQFIETENWVQAHRIVKSLELNNCTDVGLLMMASETLAKVDDYPAALKCFHQLLDVVDEKDPILFEVYKNMGNLYLKCGDIDAAEEKYNQANSINSQDESLIINYGVLAIQKGDYDEAKSRFSQVLTVNGASDLAWVGLGLVHRAHADHELARACLLRGLDENPYNKMAISNYYQWCYLDGVDTTDFLIGQFLEKYPEDMEIQKLSQGLHQ
jgi:tetratricopeptide (TPR) repeat protein